VLLYGDKELLDNRSDGKHTLDKGSNCVPLDDGGNGLPFDGGGNELHSDIW